ncbi:hypothetical protein [Cuspidothrix issatschenkoi]|uniref:hypothetical protein n=1 Tax=Cuspidothrix issatschenkoi TaxID=230752 RepID=UPI001D140C22|nr:hypothetical protein [Cuspidothrix issatschenkoi]
MQLVILALDAVKTPQRLNIRWNKKYHRQTERWLIKLLNQPQDNNLTSNQVNQEMSAMVNLDNISEVNI